MRLKSNIAVGRNPRQDTTTTMVVELLGQRCIDRCLKWRIIHAYGSMHVWQANGWWSSDLNPTAPFNVCRRTIADP